MVKVVEKYSDIPKGNGKYIFSSRKLVVSTQISEQHIDLQQGGGINKDDVTIAGGFTNLPDQKMIPIDGSGSTTLEIDRKDASVVVEFVKKLPGVKEENIDVFSV